MKVIFLDHDGVICLNTEWSSRYKKQKKFGRKLSQSVMDMPVDARFDNFNKKAVDVLNMVLEETDAEIVVSSDWRHHANLDEMGDYYIGQGVVKRPIGFTEFFRDAFPSEWTGLRFRAELEYERHREIQKWLVDNPHATHWVAVDDLNMSTEFFRLHFASNDQNTPVVGLPNFVHTPRPAEGIKQSGIKEKIISFLK